MITFNEFDLWLKINNIETWNDIYNSICDENRNHLNKNLNQLKGDILEYIAKYYYLRNGYKTYLYREIPNNIKLKLKLPKNDIGIDLIYHDNNNDKWIGIQCKFRKNINHCIQKKYVAEFLYEIEDSKLDYGILFTNVTKESPRFRNNKKLKYILKKDLDNFINKELIKYIHSRIKLRETNMKKYNKKYILRDYQKHAVNKLINDDSNRKQIIMACGTGKSIVMFEYLKRRGTKGKKILLLFPSLFLISQMYERINHYFKKKLNILCICSNMDGKTLGENNISNKRSNELLKEFISLDRKKIYTTDENIINKRLNEKEIIVLSTYQSSSLLKDKKFDIAIYDEAHKTVNEKFGFTLKNINCFIKERLYFTATQRIYDKKGKGDYEYSMDNENIYGKEIFNYTFEKAIREKHILDYDIILFSNKKQIQKQNTNTNIKKSAIQLANLIKNKRARKILTYHNSINKSKIFKKCLDNVFNKIIPNIDIDTYHMSGDMSIKKRNEIFENFNNENISVICSSKVLNEGVDIPIVDTIVFVEPRKSVIDITQCVGRGLRKYNDLKKCNIVVPLEYDNVNNKHSYENIINILKVLKIMDSQAIDNFILLNANNKNILDSYSDTNTEYVKSISSDEDINSDIIKDIYNRCIELDMIEDKTINYVSRISNEKYESINEPQNSFNIFDIIRKSAISIYKTITRN